jgi:hypothetical protein
MENGEWRSLGCKIQLPSLFTAAINQFLIYSACSRFQRSSGSRGGILISHSYPVHYCGKPRISVDKAMSVAGSKAVFLSN